MYQTQFANMESALAALQSQSAALSSIGTIGAGTTTSRVVVHVVVRLVVVVVVVVVVQVVVDAPRP